MPADFVCEHGLPQPWVTCNECMFLPFDLRPQPPKPKPEPPISSPLREKFRVVDPESPRTKPKRSRSRSRRTLALPRTANDVPPELVGDKDLAYEIPAYNLRYHIQGVDRDWLPISTMPSELRPEGWVYLKSDDRVMARSQVKGIGFRDRRWTHEQSGSSHDTGPGATLELDGEWAMLSTALGPDVEVAGYRYLITDADGSVRQTGS